MVFKILALLIATSAQAATLRTNDSQQFLNAKTPRNYIINSGAEKNILNILDSSGIVTRTTTTPLEGGASFSITATGLGQTVSFLAAPFQAGLHGQNCEARFTYSGDGTLYSAQAELASVAVSAVATLTNVSSGSREVSLNFPCGTSSSNVPSIRILASISAPAIKVDSVYIGAATNIGITNGGPAIAYTPVFTNITPSSSTVYSQCVASNRMAIWGKVTSSGAGSASELRIGLPVGAAIDTTAAPATTVIGYGARSTSAAAAYGVLSNGNSSYLTFGAQASGNAGLTTLTAAQVFDAALTFSFFSEFPVSSGCASEQVLKIGAPYVAPTAYTPTITGAGTVTNNSGTAQCSGGMLQLQGRFTVGTPTATEARIAFPTLFTSADSSQIPLLRQVGGMSLNNISATAYQTLVEPSVTYLTAAYQNAGTAGLTKQNGNSIWGTGIVVSWFATVPVDSNSPCAAASMPLVKNAVTTSSPAMLNINTATILVGSASTCTVSSQLGSWISPTCTASGGQATITLLTGQYAATPYCWGGSNSTFNSMAYSYVARVVATSSTNINAWHTYTSGATTAAEYGNSFNIYCMGAK